MVTTTCAALWNLIWCLFMKGCSCYSPCSECNRRPAERTRGKTEEIFAASALRLPNRMRQSGPQVITLLMDRDSWELGERSPALGRLLVVARVRAVCSGASSVCWSVRGRLSGPDAKTSFCLRSADLIQGCR